MFTRYLIIILMLVATLFTNNNALAITDNNIKDEKQTENASVEKNATLINIQSDQLEYFQELDQFFATGNVVITVENDGTVIESDEVIYDRPNEQIISEKKVKITKDGAVIYGDYAKFDLTKESALISNPDAYLTKIKLDAKTAKIHSGEIQALKGKAVIDQNDMMLVLSAGAVDGNRQKEFFQKRPGVESRFNYDIKAKEVIVEDDEYKNLITLRHASISINKFKIARVPSLVINAAKGETTRIETTLPEFGHLRELGSYIGYGHVFNLPRGSTLKLAPLFTFGDGVRENVGVGGMGRFMSSSNRTEVFYSTLREKFVYQGEQKIFTPFTKFQYSQNAYVENGFFGRQKNGFLWELVDDRTIAEGNNLRFSLRSSAGLVEKEEGNYSSGRFQLQGSLRNIKPLWTYGEHIGLGFGSNFSVAAYGTGDTYGVLRIGPALSAITEKYTFMAAYYQGGVYGTTPFISNEYRYGKSNLVLRGSADITDKLTVGYMTSLNLTEDNWEKDLVTENRLFVAFGPEDLKFKVGYDMERATTMFGFDMLVGAETSALEFEKLRVIQK